MAGSDQAVGQRIEFGSHLLADGFGQMGIDLGAADAGMAQENLHHAQLDALFQEPGGKAVAQAVGREARDCLGRRRRR